jgi:hypothetical protein
VFQRAGLAHVELFTLLREREKRNMEPYENIVIGNFLYSLGLTVGQESQGSVRPMCVNLMQQTPLDERLGDVMVANTGVTLLICTES